MYPNGRRGRGIFWNIPSLGNSRMFFNKMYPNGRRRRTFEETEPSIDRINQSIVYSTYRISDTFHKLVCGSQTRLTVNLPSNYSTLPYSWSSHLVILSECQMCRLCRYISPNTLYKNNAWVNCRKNASWDRSSQWLNQGVSWDALCIHNLAKIAATVNRLCIRNLH